MARFTFAFDKTYRPLLAAIGVKESGAETLVNGNNLTVRFGRWTLKTTLDNIVGEEVTGPFAWYRAIGTRLSLKDRGLTFGTTPRAGVLLTFREPVPGIDPFGLIKHPNLTVTLADPGGFLNAIHQHRHAPAN